MRTDRNVDRPVDYEIDIAPNESGGYYARVPDFPTIFTGGQTPDEAMRNAIEAMELMIEELRERGMDVPRPKSGYSGHFNVRVPKDLHRELARRAESEGVSLNALVTFILTQNTRPDVQAKLIKARRKRSGNPEK